MESRSHIQRIEERRLSRQFDALADQVRALPNDRKRVLEMLLTQEVYTVQEVATLLRVHPHTIRRAIQAGRLKAFKVGAQRAAWRITAEELNRFMGEQDILRTETTL